MKIMSEQEENHQETNWENSPPFALASFFSLHLPASFTLPTLVSSSTLLA